MLRLTMTGVSRSHRSMSDFGSEMGAARLGQATSDAVIVTLRRSLTWTNAFT